MSRRTRRRPANVIGVCFACGEPATKRFHVVAEHDTHVTLCATCFARPHPDDGDRGRLVEFGLDGLFSPPTELLFEPIDLRDLFALADTRGEQSQPDHEITLAAATDAELQGTPDGDHE